MVETNYQEDIHKIVKDTLLRKIQTQMVLQVNPLKGLIITLFVIFQYRYIEYRKRWKACISLISKRENLTQKTKLWISLTYIYVNR